MKFAEKLRALRDAAGLSEAKLADASGVSFSAIHEYGLGRRKPSFDSVVKIARALGATCEAFADCDDVGQLPEAPKKRPAKSKAPASKPKRSRKST